LFIKNPINRKYFWS